MAKTKSPVPSKTTKRRPAEYDQRGQEAEQCRPHRHRSHASQRDRD